MLASTQREAPLNPVLRGCFASKRWPAFSGHTARAMSQENVALVRQVYEQFNRSGKTPWELFDPEIRWEIDPEANLAGVYHGHEGVREYLSRATEAAAIVGIEVEEVMDSGDQVLATVRVRARGSGTRIEVEQRFWQLWRLREGKAVAFRVYLRRKEALEAFRRAA